MASSPVARKGRQLQRYDDDNNRLVAGCIPYRLTDSGGGDDDDGDRHGQILDRLQVLMISTPNRQDLVFPKGGWETDEDDICAAACRETFEEAGVKGVINRKALGVWEFRSKSSENSSICSPRGGGCKGYIFAMEVTEELDLWPEQDSHGRCWVPLKDAYELCRYVWMRLALDELVKRFSGITIASASAAEVAEPPNPPCIILSATTRDRAIAFC